jgi:hypothetical protein
MSMVQELKDLLACFQGKTFRDPETLVSVQTNEVGGPEQGKDAVFEAIATLKTLGPLPPLKLSKGLTQAARDHCYDIGPQGGASHVGTDGSTMTDRIEKYGRWHRAISENISFSETSGRSIVLQFLVDDGNESRSHRKNIFNPEYPPLTQLRLRRHRLRLPQKLRAHLRHRPRRQLRRLPRAAAPRKERRPALQKRQRKQRRQPAPRLLLRLAQKNARRQAAQQ